MTDRTSRNIERTGPMLHLRGHSEGRLHLAALVISTREDAPPLETEAGEVAAKRLCREGRFTAHRYEFWLPARADAWYALEGERYDVNADVTGDLRIAFVSCNGQENGDLERTEDERNMMWGRLAADHRAQPFNLALNGGDQIYADEVTEAHKASRYWPDSFKADLSEREARELEAALSEAFMRRYLIQCTERDPAWLMARVPSLAMWDDHDICDGWGSLQEWKLDSDVGQVLFRTARKFFLLFQMGCAPDEVPQVCPDRSGSNLGWAVALPGLSLVAPDLRSERRPERVMAAPGWEAFRKTMREAGEGRVLVVSSVPALGPRLSIVERIMILTPWREEYEDDLRDQWQSRWHRQEWCDFLTELIGVHERPGCDVTVLSGEIHLATRGTMRTGAGDLHQLVASGITHPPPPRAYAACLGGLARFGEGPLSGHPIRLHRLPGLRRIYAAERNYLVLERKAGAWTAFWDLEESGPTPALEI